MFFLIDNISNQLFLLAVIIAAPWGLYSVLSASYVLSYLILPQSAEEDKDCDLFRDKTQRAQQAREDEEEGSEPPTPCSPHFFDPSPARGYSVNLGRLRLM